MILICVLVFPPNYVLHYISMCKTHIFGNKKLYSISLETDFGYSFSSIIITLLNFNWVSFVKQDWMISKWRKIPTSWSMRRFRESRALWSMRVFWILDTRYWFLVPSMLPDFCFKEIEFFFNSLKSKSYVFVLSLFHFVIWDHLTYERLV